MKEAIKNVVNDLLKPLGFSLEKIENNRKTVDLRTEVKNPLEGYYWTCGAPFVMNVKIKRCFSIEFPGSAEYNPFVETLKKYGEGQCADYVGSPMEDFYEKWQPGKADGFYKNGKELAPPWDQGYKSSKNLSDARLKRNDFVKAQSELGEVGEIKGHLKKGPVSLGFGKITFQRFIKIYNSIRHNGYQPEKLGSGHINGRLYVRDGKDYRVAISAGKHRVAVLQALGYSKIPVKLSTVIIKREDVDFWPNVRNGNYSKEDALAYFDRIFDNEHPSLWRPEAVLNKEVVKMA
ncbi:hypothetical protein KIH41_07085 [Litoribacter ruber]|uniref:Uncharacterized protein n=1 Tax=Litoribacter ruber TaxID=702568 RepID=A0AAP2CDZ0_9BACT|nr:MULTISPECIES: hypothetical protein [Litoribacter]MBS9522523.1 hypothetical protein [Litoribacter alkaliphilus]MBT0811043.1 hypothetical protein [Litoribacter ruber]